MAIDFNRFEEIARALVPKHRGSLRCFHVSGLYKKNRLISIGFNQEKTHPKIKKYNYYNGAGKHAEFSACIRGGEEDYSDHTMLVLRVDKNNRLNYSRPCAGCIHCLQQFNIEKVFYTDKLGHWQILNPFETKINNRPDRY